MQTSQKTGDEPMCLWRISSSCFLLKTLGRVTHIQSSSVKDLAVIGERKILVKSKRLVVIWDMDIWLRPTSMSTVEYDSDDYNLGAV